MTSPNIHTPLEEEPLLLKPEFINCTPLDYTEHICIYMITAILLFHAFTIHHTIVELYSLNVYLMTNRRHEASVQRHVPHSGFLESLITFTNQIHMQRGDKELLCMVFDLKPAWSNHMICANVHVMHVNMTRCVLECMSNEKHLESA